MKISLVTTNKGKFEEIAALFKEYDIEVEWINKKYDEDNEDAIEDTAKKAAKKLANELGKPIVLEDTGLFFEAYDGFPGQSPKFVFKTLGYKGIFKLLDGESRKAYFKTAAAYCEPGGEQVLLSVKCMEKLQKRFLMSKIKNLILCHTIEFLSPKAKLKQSQT